MAKVKARAQWWGTGDPPRERWPDVSIDFKAEWSSARSRWETHAGRYYFETEAADHATGFFPLFLKHHIGEFAGQPFVLRDDQAQLIVRPAFGWKRTSDGTRRFRKVFAFCPKGYGKSPLGAGIGLYLARYDKEAAAEVYAVAADRMQARIVHTNAKIFVENSAELSDGCEILRDSIIWQARHSAYLVISADAATAHGKRPHGVIFDEMHAQPNRDLYEALSRSMPKRRQPLMVIITHAGTDDEGICFEEYDLAKRVLSGAVELETTLPVIFEMAPDDDWASPAVWQRVNPGHGVTVQHDAIVEEAAEAAAEPRKLNDFLRYHGNRWTNQATAWIPVDWWDACAATASAPMPSDAELAGMECCAGLDLAQKWDLAAFVVVFRQYLESAESVEVLAEDALGSVRKKSIALNYRLFVKPFFWIPEETMREHEKKDQVPYSSWERAGLVTATEGDIIDYSKIYSDIMGTIVPRYQKLKSGTIGYDPAFATDIVSKLRDVGGLKVIELLQNYRMLSEPCQVMEALIKGRRVRHDGNRVLRNHWENAAVKTDDAGRIRPVKPKNQSKHIDGAVGMILGNAALSLAPPVEEHRFEMLFFGGGKRAS